MPFLTVGRAHHAAPGAWGIMLTPSKGPYVQPQDKLLEAYSAEEKLEGQQHPRKLRVSCAHPCQYDQRLTGTAHNRKRLLFKTLVLRQ